MTKREGNERQQTQLSKGYTISKVTPNNIFPVDYVPITLPLACERFTIMLSKTRLASIHYQGFFSGKSQQKKSCWVKGSSTPKKVSVSDRHD